MFFTTVNFGYKGFSLIRDYAKGPKGIGSNFAAVGYKRLIKLVPADLLYPKLTVLSLSFEMLLKLFHLTLTILILSTCTFSF